MSFVRVNGIELHYELDGPEQAPVIVFSNSIGTTAGMWSHQARGLADRYRCLRYDTRGHGRSEVVDRAITIDDLAGDLAGLLDALGISRAHVVGLSLGGMTAQALAAARPDLVDRLVLMATAARLPPPEAWAQRAETVRREGMAAIVDAVIPRWFTPAFVQDSPAEVARVRDRFVRMDPRGYAVCCGVIQNLDLRPQAAAIRAPTLIVAGADDPATPVSMMEDLRQRIVDSELVVLPRAAHLLAIERADAVNRYLDAFLAPAPGRL